MAGWILNVFQPIFAGGAVAYVGSGGGQTYGWLANGSTTLLQIQQGNKYAASAILVPHTTVNIMHSTSYN